MAMIDLRIVCFLTLMGVVYGWGEPILNDLQHVSPTDKKFVNQKSVNSLLKRLSDDSVRDQTPHRRDAKVSRDSPGDDRQVPRYHVTDRRRDARAQNVNKDQAYKTRGFMTGWSPSNKQIHKKDTIVSNSDACEGGRRITCKVGTVMSPGYPDGYYSNSNCSWQIVAEPGKVIEVDFVDFSLPEAENCVDQDHVMITDIGSGYGETPPVTFCGKAELPKFSTVGNEAHIQFVTDGETEDKGFLFNFQTRDPIPCEDTIEIMDESGSLTSENYPMNYRPHSDCRWRLVSPQGTTISIALDDVALEQARSCEWDKVEIHDGPSRQSSILGIFCGHRQSQTIQSTGNVVLVVLMSDGSGEDRGFSLNWEAVNA